MKERSATSCLKVLIVEDHPVTKLILLRWLRNQTFDVHFCSTEEEALDRLSHDVWHVLLTDLHLASDSDALDHQTGLLLLKYVRTVWPNVSCILMTAWGDQVSLSKAVRLGVDRILIKPLKSDDFLSVLHRLDQARKTRDALTKATHELELRRKSIEKLRERERQFALLIQESLLFDVPPHPLPGVFLSHQIRSLYEVSGDVLDVTVRVQDCIDVLLGDVMGKDMAAALLSAGMKSVLATTQDKSVKGLMNAVLARMTPMLQSVDSFLTCIFLRIDTRAGTLEMVDFGAPPLLIQRSDLVNTVIQASGQMMPLGIERNPVSSMVLPLYPGDRVLLMSDGILDGMAQSDTRIAIDQVAQELLCMPAKQEDALCHRLIEISEDPSGHPDDRVCLALRFEPLATTYPDRKTAEFADSLQEMRNMRSWLTGLFAHLHLSDHDWSDGILLGCTEVFSNIVKHGQPIDSSAQKIRMLVTFINGVCHIEWHFNMRPFDFDPDREAKLPSPESMSESGYGMFLVNHLFDRVHYFTHSPGHQSIMASKTLPES
jgi:serine phosphatase RsbU (regulator of sigma subunit)/anti-sigma regulatory factor (Ser/Thr protein kinase)